MSFLTKRGTTHAQASFDHDMVRQLVDEDGLSLLDCGSGCGTPSHGIRGCVPPLEGPDVAVPNVHILHSCLQSSVRWSVDPTSRHAACLSASQHASGMVPVSCSDPSINICAIPPATVRLLEQLACSLALCGHWVPSAGAGTGSQCR